MNIYLSGPITGHEDTAEQRFREAAEALRALCNVDVIYNPVEEVPVGTPHAEAMIMDLNELTSHEHYVKCHDADYHAVVALPGYESSEGCKLECAVARAVGIPVVELTDALDGGLEGLQ